MPPASKKDVSVILFDVATRDQAAKQTLVKISTYNYLTDSKDLTKLILLNTKSTSNRLNTQSRGYKNIKEACEDVTKYNPQRLLEMIDENNETENANWLEGLIVALRSLEEDYRDIGGIVTYQLLFITDLKTPLEKYDKSLVKNVVRGLNQLDAFLYVVGPDIEVPFVIKNQNDLRSWMKNLTVDESNQNLTTLKEIITGTTNSVVCNYKMGTHLFFSHRNWSGSQPWQVPLAIGSKVEIPAQTLKILDDNLPCKLTKVGGTIRETMWIDAEDESEEIDSSEVISGIMRHEKFVQMPENKMFQVENPRGFSVICFTDSVNVPEYLMRGGGCYCVLPNSTPEKNEALDILIDCLARQNKYVIARRVYNANLLPRIVALVPKPDYKPKCFLLTPLPYSEDIRLSYKERKVEMAPETDVKEEVYKFLDSITVDGDNPGKSLPLGINMMMSDGAIRIVNKAADKLLDTQMNLDEIDIDLVGVPSGGNFEALKSIWPERTFQQVKENEKKDNIESDDEFDWS